jgi:hypothetical protein
MQEQGSRSARPPLPRHPGTDRGRLYHERLPRVHCLGRRCSKLHPETRFSADGPVGRAVGRRLRSHTNSPHRRVARQLVLSHTRRKLSLQSGPLSGGPPANHDTGGTKQDRLISMRTVVRAHTLLRLDTGNNSLIPCIRARNVLDDPEELFGTLPAVWEGCFVFIRCVALLVAGRLTTSNEDCQIGSQTWNPESGLRSGSPVR